MDRYSSRGVPPEIRVGMVVVAYRRPGPLACLLHSFLCQTHQNFEIIVMHDGPGPEVRPVVEVIDDPRINLIETDCRRGHHGHPMRHQGFQLSTADYLGTTNDDNYYVPVYFEWMLASLLHDKSQFVFCDFVRSRRQWRPHRSEPRTGGLDCGAWLAEASLVRRTPWTDMSHTGDGAYIESLTARARGISRVESCLFVHN